MHVLSKRRYAQHLSGIALFPRQVIILGINMIRSYEIETIRRMILAKLLNEKSASTACGDKLHHSAKLADIY
jgi:hypothetical protein